MRAFALRHGLAICAVAALSACTGAATVQPGYVTSAYELGLMRYIADRGGLPTDVSGNPFKDTDEHVHATVRDTMEKSHFGPHFPFLAKKPQGFSSPYRMVVAIDAAGNPGYYKLCDEGVQQGGATKADGGTVRVAAALCAGDSLVTGTAGRVSGVKGPDDPNFIALIAQVTYELFPLKDEHDRDQPEIMFP